ncbi:MAG TPA: enoyl-CoA hydratase-related protein [Solirubrobacteraceae bacterium]|jgi:enoyl-CoA hydratase/carnithine racemase|nr:enoyl-CoA hydratase-related protein [Solirubrobacteraceae bacterium]
MSATAPRQQHGHTHVLRIDRPEPAKSIDLATARVLSQAFDELEEDESVWAVVLIGAGQHVFPDGTDLGAVASGDADAINGVLGGVGGLVRRDFSKPLIAAVNGAALGGGFELVLACDLVVASTDARFGLPEVKRGLTATSRGALRLVRRISPALAMAQLLTGNPIDAHHAFELGLINRVVPAEEVLDHALALADAVCANGPIAVRMSKTLARGLGATRDDWAWRLNRELSPRVMASEDAAQAMRTDGEREPVSQGR